MLVAAVAMVYAGALEYYRLASVRDIPMCPMTSKICTPTDPDPAFFSAGAYGGGLPAAGVGGQRSNTGAGRGAEGV